MEASGTACPAWQPECSSVMEASQHIKSAMNGTRPAPVLHELGWLAGTPLVRLADRIFGEHADIGLALAIACTLPFLRGALDYLLFKPLGKWMICGSTRKQPTANQNSLIYKWKESWWKAVMYLSMAVAAFAATRNISWFVRSRAMWDGCTQIPCDYDVPAGVRLLYCLEMGFYMQAIPSLLFWEVRRKDFLESLAHHLATLTLIMYSYYINVTKVGAVVFLLHDVNDIFLELAKMFRYARVETVPNIFFGLFLASWIVTRLALFPNWVIRSTLIDTVAVAKEQPVEVNVSPHYEIFNALLILLLVLHIYWTWLIIKVLTRVLKGSMAADVREADDDSDAEIEAEIEAEVAAEKED